MIYCPGHLFTPINIRIDKRKYFLTAQINDIPMFQVSDESYAVANAVEELKAIATGVIESNNKDGVARGVQTIQSARWKPSFAKHFKIILATAPRSSQQQTLFLLNMPCCLNLPVSLLQMDVLPIKYCFRQNPLQLCA